jgi:hypothetical protein
MADIKSKLYEYAIIQHGRVTKAEEELGKRPVSSVLVEPKRVLVRDENEALLTAAREIPVEFISRLDEIEVLIRPF